MPKTVITYSDEELGLNPGWDEQLDPNISEMRRHAKITERENRELKQEVAGFRRLAGFASAGVPQDEKGQAFAKIYEGSDDPTEIRDGYQKLFGAIEAATGGTAGAELDAEGRIAAAGSAGASQGVPGTIDIGEAIKGAKTNAEVIEIIRTNGKAAGLSLPADS